MFNHILKIIKQELSYSKSPFDLIQSMIFLIRFYLYKFFLSTAKQRRDEKSICYFKILKSQTIVNSCYVFTIYNFLSKNTGIAFLLLKCNLIHLLCTHLDAQPNSSFPSVCLKTVSYFSRDSALGRTEKVTSFFCPGFINSPLPFSPGYQ